MDLQKFNLGFLKDYIGEIIWSPCYGNVRVNEVTETKIIVVSEENHKKHTFNLDGTHYVGKGLCMLYGGEEWYKYFDGKPEESWKRWLEAKKKVHHKVKISVHKEIGDHSDPSYGSYSFDFDTLSGAIDFARDVLDYCKKKYQG